MTTAIEDLDEDLAAAGEDIIIRRVTWTAGVPSNNDVTVRAVVRAVKAEEIQGTIAQTDLYVIMSPTEITEKPWPSASTLPASPLDVDARIPKVGDKAVIQGKPRDIKLPKPFLEDGALVRIELVVSG